MSSSAIMVNPQRLYSVISTR
jgi:hypothetical protein